MGTKTGGGLVGRAVREALSTLVSPSLCDQLISRSLASQGLSDVPESGSEIGRWLEGALRGEVESTVGPDAAELMMVQLGPIAAYAAVSQPSGALASLSSPLPPPGSFGSAAERATDVYSPSPSDWPSIPPLGDQVDNDVSATPVVSAFPADTMPASSGAFDSEPPTGVFVAPKDRALSRDDDASVRKLPPSKRISELPPAPRDQRGETTRPAAIDGVDGVPKMLPLVLAATARRAAFHELQSYLANAASVMLVPDLVGLLDALNEPEVVEPILLIDCQHPSVHASSVAQLGEDLPRGTTVVLWGIDDASWSQLDRTSNTCRWVRCSNEATSNDVGSLCSMLLS